MTQFSLFGAAAADPARRDLDGVLLAGGRWVRSGDMARLSVVVHRFWRAEALAEEFATRAVADEDAIVSAAEGWSVRTAFARELAAEAARWSHGANETTPPGFAVTPGGLRLWAMAAGAGDEGGYLLGTHRGDTALHLAAGAQLSRLGIAAVSVGSRGGGPGWRITSMKRLRRFAELVGPAPEGANDDWPG